MICPSSFPLLIAGLYYQPVSTQKGSKDAVPVDTIDYGALLSGALQVFGYPA
jgi:hypothetical protein